MSFDFLIVGAGFSGLVCAERLCNEFGKRCLVVDRRDHLGGNAHDRYDENGVLIHPYGPHYFRTNSDMVFRYLSRFTDWIPGHYHVQSFTGGRYWSFPINLITFEQFLGRASSQEEMEEWLASHRESVADIRNSEDVVVSKVGWDFYRLFFENYTRKQWRRHPRELDASVCGRIPVRTHRDERYLNEKYQVLPSRGYHRLFENLVDSCGDRLVIELGTDYRDVDPSSARHTVFTGPIDLYFDFRFGPLPYRTLRFEHRHFAASELPGDPETNTPSGYHQPVVQVNYPGTEPYTRIVEAKHITGQKVAGSTIVREFPEEFEVGREPYYPIPSPDSRAIYEQYASAAAGLADVTFLGRLGNYRYYNMDEVVAAALRASRRLAAGGG